MLKNLNYHWYRFKYRNARELKLKKPVDVSLELSSHCTAQCTYCYHSDTKNVPFEKGFMRYETAEKILNDAAKLKVPSVKFNWKGEATMNKSFKDIAATAYILSTEKVFIDRICNTNFNFSFNKDDIFTGLFYMTKVKVSFDSFRKDVLESQRKGTVYERALDNIKYFHDHPYRKGTKLVIQSVRTQLNKDEDLEWEIKRRFPDAEVSIRDVVEGRVDKDLSQSLVKDRPRERESCVQAHARLIFNWQGVAFPCCVDIKERYRLGNIHNNKMIDIWNSHQAVLLRKRLKNKSAFLTEPCKTCSSHESYAGWKPPRDS